MGDLGKDVGLFMLGTTGAAGLWALFTAGFYEMIYRGVSSTSPTTDEVSAITLSMNIGLGATVVNGLAIWLLNGKSGVIPGIASAGMGAALYLAYKYLLDEAINPGTPVWVQTPTKF